MSPLRLGNVTAWRTFNVSLSLAVVGIAAIMLPTLFGWALAHEEWRSLGALTMVALLPIAIRWPVIFAFGLYAFLVPFDTAASLFEAGGTTLTKVVGVYAGAVLAAAALVERRFGRPPMASLWFGLFVLWAALSAAWSIDPHQTLAGLKTIVSLFVLYLIAVCIRPSPKEFDIVCLLLVIGGAIVAVLCYLYSISDEGGWMWRGRGRLVIGDQEMNPNAVTDALVVPLALAVGGFLRLRVTILRAIALGLVGIIGAGMYSSMSRGGLLVVLAMIGVFVYRRGPRRQVVLPIVVLAALVVGAPEAFHDRIEAVFSGTDATGTGRTEIWKVGILALDRFWLLGSGLRTYADVYGFYVPGSLRSAHNLYLAVWVELGILGLALMLAAIGSHLIAVWGAKEPDSGGVILVALEAASFGMLALNFIGEGLSSKSFWLLWILLTWATYCNRRSTESSRWRLFGGRQEVLSTSRSPSDLPIPARTT